MRLHLTYIQRRHGVPAVSSQNAPLLNAVVMVESPLMVKFEDDVEEPSNLPLGVRSKFLVAIFVIGVIGNLERSKGR